MESVIAFSAQRLLFMIENYQTFLHEFHKKGIHISFNIRRQYDASSKMSQLLLSKQRNMFL